MRRLSWALLALTPVLGVPASGPETANAPSVYAPAGSTARPDPPPDPVLVRLRAKVNPEFPAWEPGYVLERCAEHLATVNEPDRCRIRYFDMSDVPRALLPQGTASLFFGSNQAARVTVTQVPRPVPHTDNRIFWFDLAWFNWTPEVWEKISEQDPYFREPIVPSDSPGLALLKNETHANAVVRGSWFIYYVYDNSQFLKLQDTFNAEAFYYLLVYANVEFYREVKEVSEEVTREPYTAYEERQRTVPAQGAWQPVPPAGYGQPYYQQQTQVITERVPVTKYRRKVARTEKVVRKKVRGVGPANAKEFQQVWQVDFRVLKDFPIDQGALVSTSHSGVSWENRLVWRIRTPIGVYWRTFDVLRSVGDQDFVETPFPKHFDAGEHIVIDSRGAQFYHLSNGRDESIDFADPRIVNNQTPYRVLCTSGACIHCHDTGIIPFKNEARRLADIGVQLRAYDYGRSERFAQFYLQDRKMQKLVQQDQQEFVEFVKDCNGLTPSENTQAFNRFRGWYGGGVTLEQAARELGTDKLTLEQALAEGVGDRDEPRGVTKGRLGALVLDGTPVPRQTWERGLYAEAALILLEWKKRGKMKRHGGD